jgi:hypothetical protein
VPAAADPCEAPALHRLGQTGKDGGVAGAPHEARPDHDPFDPLGVPHELLRLRLGGAVERLRVRRERLALVDAHHRLAVRDGGLGAHVHEAARTGLARSGENVARALHVRSLEVLARAPLAQRRRAVEHHVGALRAGTHRGHVVQVARDGLRSALAHGGGGAVGAGQGANCPALVHQAPDQSPSDEARSPGDESRATHHGRPYRGLGVAHPRVRGHNGWPGG